MKRTVKLAALAMTMIVAAFMLGGCKNAAKPPSTVSKTFRITDAYFHRLPSQSSTCGTDHEEIVSGSMTIDYIPGDGTVGVTFEWAFGRNDPSAQWNFAGSDDDLDGHFVFDTTFTGKNWVTIRGIATTKDGKTVVDSRVVNIDNIPPDVTTDPRDQSVLNLPPAAIVMTVVDGGYTKGPDLPNTYVEVTRDGIPIECVRTNRPDEIDVGHGQIDLVPTAGWPDGNYTVTTIAKDLTGNIGSPVCSSFRIDSTIPGIPPAARIIDPSSGIEVRGSVDISYEVSPDVEEVSVDWAFGCPNRSPVAWRDQKVLQDSSIYGHCLFDTTFTGSNCVSVRLFVKSTSGLTAVSNPIYFYVRNR